MDEAPPSQNQFLDSFHLLPPQTDQPRLSLLCTLPTAFSSAQVAKTEASRPTILPFSCGWIDDAKELIVGDRFGVEVSPDRAAFHDLVGLVQGPQHLRLPKLHSPPRTRSAAPPRAPPAGPPGKHIILPEGLLVTHPHPHCSPVSKSDARSET